MTQKIEKLTPEQEKEYERIAEEWLKIGLCTDPADRETAEKGIRIAYQKVDLPPPEQIIWVDSPPAAARKAAELAGGTPASHLSGFVYGQHSAGWLSFYDAMNRILGIDVNELEGLMMVAKSAGWWIPLDTVAIVCERPSALSIDARDRLHCENGPAVAFRDGHKYYFWHGVTVPEHVVERPETITYQEIENERNAEVRRVMLERYGTERFLRDSGAVKFAEDEYGELYRKELPGDEPIVMVRLVNSTPEGVRPGQWYWWNERKGCRVTDNMELKNIGKHMVATGKRPAGYKWVCAGTPEPVYKEYWIRVPPDMQRPRQALAWGFQIPEEMYSPVFES